MKRSLHAIAMVATMAAGPAAAATPVAPVAVQAVRVADFIDTLGVNTHLGYNDGGYANVRAVLRDLNYLGIRQVRDSTPDPNGGSPYRAYLASIAVAVKAGIRFDLVVDPALPITTSLDQVERLMRHGTQAVTSIEGPNEINNAPVRYRGQCCEAAAEAFQHDLYAAVKADPLLRKLPVYYLTGGRRIDLDAGPGLADYANGHPYLYQGGSPGSRIVDEFKTYFTMPLPYPRVITETGYFDQPDDPAGSGVDGATQARLTLDLLFDAFRQGVGRTYLYQLLSAYPDAQRNSPDIEYGLFNQDNSPKPVAAAIHNLTSMLSDTATTSATFTPGRLDYSVSGLPATGQSVLLQRESGSYILVVWAEPRIWNEATHTPEAAPVNRVVVTLAARASRISVRDPLLGVASARTYANANAVSLDLSDHPIVLVIQR